MLSSLLKDHLSRSSVRRAQNDKLREEADAAAANLTAALVDHLNVGVAQAYLNQKRLDAEAKQLHTNATEFSKQTSNWLQLVNSFNTTLKDLGDVESWSKAIEADMTTVHSTLEYAYKVNSEANSAGAAASSAASQQQ